MKAITIQQPWASLIILGHKQIETRSWATKYRGKILIHASAKKPNKEVLKQLEFYLKSVGMENYEYPTGRILGEAEITEVVKSDDVIMFADPKRIYRKWVDFTDGKKLCVSQMEFTFGDYSPSRYGFIMHNIAKWEIPFPCKGQLSLWNFGSKQIAQNFQDKMNEDLKRLSPWL